MKAQRFRNVQFSAIALTLILGTATVVQAEVDPLAKYAEPEEPGLPASNMVLDLPRTAIVITDPQIDFLSPDGVNSLSSSALSSTPLTSSNISLSNSL